MATDSEWTTDFAVVYDVYNDLGHEFLKSVYEHAMSIALSSRGLETKRQYPLPVWFRNEQIGDFRAIY
jgi:GxxExxY protein